MQLAYFMRALENAAPPQIEVLMDALIEGRDSLAAAVKQGKQHDQEAGESWHLIASRYGQDDARVVFLNDLVVRLTADLSIRQPAAMVG